MVSLTLAERIQRTLVIGMSRTPPWLLGRLTRPQVNRSGNRMEADAALLMRLFAMDEDFSDQSAVEAREGARADSRAFGDHQQPLPIEHEVRVNDVVVATRYSAGNSPRGLILFFHGGGFVFGSRATHEGFARLLARGIGVDVVSVEYRLAPEDPFPAPHDDAVAAWECVLAHAGEWGVDPARVVVVGDSAGGSIAAVLCQTLRGRDLEPLAQVLIYPATDLSTRHPSRREFAALPALTAKQIDWVVHHYVPGGIDWSDPRLSPLLAPSLVGLPRAVVVTAGFDPLRDEGEAYYEALVRCGVRAELVREGGLVHGFVSFTAISPSSKAATDRVVRKVAEVLADPAP